MTDNLRIPLMVTGSHHPKEGVGCVMNLVNWEDGRITVTNKGNLDWESRGWDSNPNYSSKARNTLIYLNDSMCQRLEEISVIGADGKTRNHHQLCVHCSTLIMDLAHLLHTSKMVRAGLSYHEIELFNSRLISLRGLIDLNCRNSMQRAFMKDKFTIFATYYRDLEKKTGLTGVSLPEARVAASAAYSKQLALRA